jgi:hypothetical protein
MVRALTRMQRWSRVPGRHKLAVAVLLLWAGVTVRIFSSFDPAWFSAQSANYGTLTVGALGFAAASLGLRAWADVQMSPPVSVPDAGVPG